MYAWPWPGGSVLGVWPLLIVSGWWWDKDCKASPTSPSQPVKAGTAFCVLSGQALPKNAPLSQTTSNTQGDLGLRACGWSKRSGGRLREAGSSLTAASLAPLVLLWSVAALRELRAPRAALGFRVYLRTATEHKHSGKIMTLERGILPKHQLHV